MDRRIKDVGRTGRLIKHKIIISIFLVLLLPPPDPAAPDEAYGIVTDVVDGDTIYVQIQGYDSRIGNISVRLADIDCPELNATGGPAAKQYAFQELNGCTVTLDLDDKTGRDRYCRWVAVVFLEEGEGTLLNFNRKMVEAGHACISDFRNNEFDPAEWWNGTFPQNHGGGLFCPSSSSEADRLMEADGNSSSCCSLLGNAASGTASLAANGPGR
ncbi:MAG TPA: thermonuclease family protein [Methanothrix sp.]|nr:thermonuclease family protein [Methanothrix sp.]HPC88952.1 thermonuclease family protein [Methanothrix sp.]HQE86886.1 thermonuclease family protein [Methanothrix sp.]HQI69019.1 thermonuclease family protein [Methanothrix sp.]HRS85178.1 thermonuclease family protein [Methanothrix sp.]